MAVTRIVDRRTSCRCGGGGTRTALWPRSPSTPRSAEMETAFDLLAAQPFLAGLTDRQLRRLSSFASRSAFHAGNRVIHEGSRADRFWLIEDGRVDVDTHLPEYGDVVVETLGPGA